MKRKAQEWSGPICPVKPAKSAVTAKSGIKAVGLASKSGLKSGLEANAFSPASVAKSIYAKKQRPVVEEEEEAPEDDGEVDETRYVGCVKPARGIGKKFSIECDEVKSAHNREAFVTIKSKAPSTLKCEDWISFNVNKDKSGLIAKDIEIEVVADALEEPVAEEPEETVEEEPEEPVGEDEVAEDEAEENEAEAEEDEEVAEDEEEAVEKPSRISRSSAVALFRNAQARGKTFNGRAEAEAEEEAEAEAEEDGAEAEEANEDEAEEDEEVAEDEEEAEEEAVEKPSKISKSSAVALFRKSLATGKTFNAGFKDGKGIKNGVISTAGTFGKPAPNLGAKPKIGKTPFQRKFLEPPEKLSKEDQKALDNMRTELEIVVELKGQGNFPPIVSFQELEGVLPDYAFEALGEMGIEAPMPIQAQALPLALAGNDIIGVAKTGSGKTLAYLLPALTHIEAQEPLEAGDAKPICLVLAPVRELAVQIADEARKLLGTSNSGNHAAGLGAVALYGGGSSNKHWQVQALRQGSQIVAATPGRLVDLMSSREVSLGRVTYFVLDEADRMLEEGFGDQVGEINRNIRADRQCLFFSATWPPQVSSLAAQMCSKGSKPVRVVVGQREGGGSTARDDIVQEVVVFDEDTWDDRDRAKQELLYAHLKEVLKSRNHKALVFVSRKTLADELTNRLWTEGFKCHSMHGGRSQDQRLNILDEYKNGDLKLLVTTDVFARGLDIPDISHVVVFDMGDIEDYVHRIGRTARGPYGKGHALTFFEYDKKWPHLPSHLLEVLQQSSQDIPEDLVRIVQEVAAGKRGGRGMW